MRVRSSPRTAPRRSPRRVSRSGMPRTRGPGSPQIVSSTPLSALLAPAGPLPLWATQNCQNVRGGYSAGRLHVLGTEHHRLQSLGLCYRPDNNMRRRRTPDQQARGLSSGGSCIASWVPGHGSEDGLEQLAEGDATVKELAQPHGARLPAFSRHPAGSRGRGASGNDAGRPAAILVGAFRRPRRKRWLSRFGCCRRGEPGEPPAGPGSDRGLDRRPDRRLDPRPDQGPVPR